MKDRVNKIFNDLKNEVITEKQAHESVLSLFDEIEQAKLSKCYSCDELVEMVVGDEFCPKCFC